MTNYLIVVPRGNAELFDLLSVAFRGHSGFHVVVDRRASESLAGPERRASGAALGPDEIVVAEGADRGDRQGPAGDVRSVYQRVPVRRRRVRATPMRHAASSEGRAAARCVSAC
jgi:hypothetical protein